MVYKEQAVTETSCYWQSWAVRILGIAQSTLPPVWCMIESTARSYTWQHVKHTCRHESRRKEYLRLSPFQRIYCRFSLRLFCGGHFKQWVPMTWRSYLDWRSGPGVLQEAHLTKFIRWSHPVFYDLKHYMFVWTRVSYYRMKGIKIILFLRKHIKLSQENTILRAKKKKNRISFFLF